MFNPFHQPERNIRLGVSDDDGFFIQITGLYANMTITCGNAETAAALMKTNDVRHFDYLDSVANTNALNDWLVACEIAGYAI